MQRNGDDYFALIPKQPYFSLIRYHFSINSPFDNSYLELIDSGNYHFFVGYDTLFYDNATSNKG